MRILGVTSSDAQHGEANSGGCAALLWDFVTIKKLLNALLYAPSQYPPSRHLYRLWFSPTSRIACQCRPTIMSSAPEDRRVLNFATRVITKKGKYDHPTEARQHLNWLPLDAMIQLRDCILIHRLINQADAPSNLKSLVEYHADVSQRTTVASTDSLLNSRR